MDPLKVKEELDNNISPVANKAAENKISKRPNTNKRIVESGTAEKVNKSQNCPNLNQKMSKIMHI